MKNKIRSILVKKDGNVDVIEFEDKLEEMYKLLDCDYIEIVKRPIGVDKREFTIICDEEARLKDFDLTDITAVENNNHEPFIVGNILIVSPNNEDGELHSLTLEEIEYIMDKGLKTTIRINW